MTTSIKEKINKSYRHMKEHKTRSIKLNSLKSLKIQNHPKKQECDMKLLETSSSSNLGGKIVKNIHSDPQTTKI